MAILDTYTNSKSGVALWKLLDSFSLDPVLIEKASDGTQQWIPFDASGYLSESALNSFLGPENDPGSEQEAYAVHVRNQVDPANDWFFTAPSFYGARIRANGQNVKASNGKLALLFKMDPYGDIFSPTTDMDIHTSGFTGVFNIEIPDVNTGGNSLYIYRNTRNTPSRGLFLAYRDGKVQVYHRNTAGGAVNSAHNAVANQNLTLDISINEAQSSQLFRSNGVTFNSIESFSLTYANTERYGDTNASRAGYFLFQCGLKWDEFRADSAAIGDEVKTYFDVSPPVSVLVGDIAAAAPTVTVSGVQVYAPVYSISVANVEQPFEITEPPLIYTPPNFGVLVSDVALSAATVSTPNVEFTDFMTITPAVQDASCLTCSNGFIELSVSGLHPPFTYLWSNGSTSSAIYNLLPGVYSVDITDSNSGQKSLVFEVEVESFEGFDFPTLFRHTEICEIYIAAVKNVQSTVLESSGKVLVTFANGNWNSCYFIKGRGNYNQNEIPTDHGSKFLHQIDFEFSGQEDPYPISIDQYCDIPVIILTRNQDGNNRVIGTKENPLFISHDFNSNSGNKVKLVAESADESRELNA